MTVHHSNVGICNVLQESDKSVVTNKAELVYWFTVDTTVLVKHTDKTWNHILTKYFRD